MKTIVSTFMYWKKQLSRIWEMNLLIYKYVPEFQKMETAVHDRYGDVLEQL